jgi:hypothetical protein
MYDLIDISKRMREQSNRSTQYPLFVVQEFLEIDRASGCGEYTKYVSYDSDIELTQEQYEAIEACQEYSTVEELEENGHDWVEYETILKEIGLSLDDTSTINLSEFRSIDYDIDWVISGRAGVFFTEEACEEHIRLNHYHYTKPRSYVISAWRNPEMVEVMKTILDATAVPDMARIDLPSHYR